MKTANRIFIGLCLFVAVCLLMLHPDLSSAAVKRGLHICSSSVLPSLFPFFVLSNLWMTLGYSARISRSASKPFSNIFHLPGAAASALLLGMTGGYPVGAQSVVQLYETKQISKQDAEHLLSFCNNAGPAFLLGVVGGGLFHSVKVGLYLWLIHLTSAVLVGILLRNQKQNPFIKPEEPRIEISFVSAFNQAIRFAGSITLQVCTFILFFSFVTEYLCHFLPNTVSSTVLISSLELTSAVKLLSETALSYEQLFVASAFLVGWGGLCVHSQSISAIHKTDLSVRHYVLGKILHAAFSTAIACIVSISVKFPIPTNRPTASLFLVSCISLLVVWLIILFLKSSSGKQPQNQV